MTIYDRLYFSRNLVKAHGVIGSYFFAKCKIGERVWLEIQEFNVSKKTKRTLEVEGLEVTLLKIKDPKKEDIEIFATNLPKKYLKKGRADELYSLRWGCETVHRDLSETMKIEKWHSKNINGIQQEIYLTLWAVNMAKIQIAQEVA